MKCPICSEEMIQVIIPYYQGELYYGEFEAYSCPGNPVCKMEEECFDNGEIKMIFFTDEASCMIELIAKVKEDR